MPTIEISVGELFDRFSILNLKSWFIKDNEKLKYIYREIKELELMVFKYFGINKYGSELYSELEETNRDLWVIEDKLREFEKDRIFDEKFIAHARMVYYKNDERAKIKSKIDELYGSEIREQKSYEEY
jgi:hypothetical protein